MYCKQCGKQISDDVKFCPRCGAAVGVGTNEANATSRAQITSDAPSTTPMSGGIAEQVNSSKQHSRRRMPMVLIIILVTLALASAAFAAVYIYTTYIAPAQEGQPAQVEPEADENNETAEEPVEEPAEEPEEPDTTSEEREQRAVYDGILNEYQDSQAQGWSNASESSLSDLSSLAWLNPTMQKRCVAPPLYVEKSAVVASTIPSLCAMTLKMAPVWSILSSPHLNKKCLFRTTFCFPVCLNLARKLMLKPPRALDFRVRAQQKKVPTSFPLM